MSEETKQNWKVERIAEYAKLEANKKAMEKKLDENTELITLRTELALTAANLDAAEKPYRADIDALSQQQIGIKSELVETWGSTEEKTFECTIGTATLRTTKSLHIRSKKKLVAFLELNTKLTEFIKSFEITKLRKIKDAGMIEDEIATWDIKHNVAISIKDTTTEEEQ